MTINILIIQVYNATIYLPILYNCFSLDDTSQSLADVLYDATREELLDSLRTVESDCIKHKEALDRLFALIVGHTPDLLSVMAEVQEKEGYV